MQKWWVFPEGHLGALGTAATGALGVQLPVSLFCIAFGLSMDYEVFLFSRIREYWLASHRGWGASDESVARGVTLVRMLLVPAFMHGLGRLNWWAPKPLARLHDRFGVSEAET